MQKTLANILIGTASAAAIVVGGAAAVPEETVPQEVLNRIEAAKEKTSKFDKAKETKYKNLVKNNEKIDDKIKSGTLTAEEKKELKAYKIYDTVKPGRYYYNTENGKGSKKTTLDKAIDRLVPDVNAQTIDATTTTTYEIEIVSTNIIDGGIEVYARAWDENGNAIGLGADGTTEIERFRIFDPRVLVPDTNGDIARSWYDADLAATTTTFYSEDLEQALYVMVGRAVVVTGKPGANIITGSIGNTTSTFYSDGDPETNTTDGFHQIQKSTWDAVHDATASDAAYDNSIVTELVSRIQGNGDRRIQRGELFFDTSSISSGDTISAASLTLTGYAFADQDFTDTIGIVQVQSSGRAGSDTALNAADYDLVGDAINNPTEATDSGERFSAANSTSGTTETASFNTTGIGWIAKSGESSPTGGTAGITYLGLRMTSDITDTDVLSGQSANYGCIAQYKSADTTGTTDDPVLTVTHAAGGGGSTRRIIRTTISQ